ncbi:hypothetical protein, partial [Cupriavidus sp.]|uniref:hypothetical protein n=1 Tax=Cupriavidus sp. TaxID=1873897 RepID=UPI003D0F03CF
MTFSPPIRQLFFCDAQGPPGLNDKRPGEAGAFGIAALLNGTGLSTPYFGMALPRAKSSTRADIRHVAACRTVEQLARTADLVFR